MSFDINKYEAFLRNKVRFAESSGFPCDLSEINPALKPHNKLMVKWLVEGGRRACFASFGLHKTVTQLEVVRLTLKNTGGRALIIAPLNVRVEFRRDADSRTLAEHLHFYIHALQPDIVQIENVVEFMSWGPLDEKGKPISKKNGEDWLRWRKEVCAHGYVDEWRELNSADYGAFTSRNRLFGIFAKKRAYISWPEPTHTKKPSTGNLFESQKKWKAVKEVLDFQDEGESIFNRKKPLSDKTLERIYAGLVKYVAKGDTAFISKYFSGKPAGKVNSVDAPSSTITTFGNSTIVQTKAFSDLSIDQPAGAITTKDHHALVQAFITQRNTGDPKTKVVDIEGPARTITGTGGNQDLVQTKFILDTQWSTRNGNPAKSLDQPCHTLLANGATPNIVQPQFLIHYYGSGGEHSSIENPAPVISTKDRTGIVKPEHFLEKSYGGYRNNQSVDQPAGSIMPNDKHRLVEASPFLMPTSYENKPKSIDEPSPTIQASRRHHYLVNPSWKGCAGSIDSPSPVIIARQDKSPLYLVQAETGPVHVAVYEDDTEIAVRIKEFMAHYNLVDIKMRMLRVHELLKIQGFPDDYKLEGNQTDQKKFIGNSVVPLVVKCWIEAIETNLKTAA